MAATKKSPVGLNIKQPSNSTVIRDSKFDFTTSVTQETLEAVKSLAQAATCNAEAIKAIAQSFGTANDSVGIQITQAPKE